MSEAMQALPHDDPLMLAWENWKTTPEFSNAKDWIVRGRNHIDGAVWRAFMEGWLAHRRATALAGIPDPAAAIAQARQALRLGLEFQATAPVTLKSSEEGHAFDVAARAALAALEAKHG